MDGMCDIIKTGWEYLTWKTIIIKSRKKKKLKNVWLSYCDLACNSILLWELLVSDFIMLQFSDTSVCWNIRAEYSFPFNNSLYVTSFKWLACYSSPGESEKAHNETLHKQTLTKKKTCYTSIISYKEVLYLYKTLPNLWVTYFGLVKYIIS